jgi:hypothetical protein
MLVWGFRGFERVYLEEIIARNLNFCGSGLEARRLQLGKGPIKWLSTLVSATEQALAP